jgi:predicted chitinase
VHKTIFLDNPGAVTSGRKYIRIRPGSRLYIKSGDTFTQTPAEVGKDIHAVLPEDKCPPEECGGKKYYRIGEGSWLSQDDVEALNQYDLKQRGFSAFVQDSTPDMLKSLTEKWVQSTFEAYSEQVVPERGIQQRQMSDFYKAMAEKLDSDKDGELSGQELYSAVHHAELGIRDIAARMTVKHVSEWSGGSSDPKWTKFFEAYDPLRIGFTKKWLDDMEWMSQVEPFSSGQAVWHMHPVVFLDAIRAISRIHITVDMLYKVFEGLRSPAKKEFLQQFADEINNNAEKYKLDTLQRVNHFFAQVREEMGGTASPVEGLNYSEEGLKANFKYFRTHPDEARKYSYKKSGGKITTRADETAIANRVYANRLGNGNVASGDGSKYCGRGGVHLTGKVNYKGFSDYYKTQWNDGADFINNPSLLESPVYCVRSAVYFWLRENLYSIADTGSTGVIVDKITAKVNLHTDSYAKRRKHFENISNKKIFVEAF